MSKPTLPQPTKHIKQEHINRMLKLQHLFHERFLTADLLNELVSTYVEAIQCFDGFYSPMRKYFLDKIQYVVSQPEIDSMLKRNVQAESMVGMLRQTIRMTAKGDNKEELFSHEILMQAIEAQNKKSRQFHEKNLKATKQKQKQNNQSNNFYIKSPDKSSLQKTEEQKANERDKKIEMQMNLMKEVSQNMKNLEIQAQQQNQRFQKKSKRINAIMEDQNNSLEARLAMRKKGKNRKKSGDQKFVQEIKDKIPPINKAELKQAQKQIAQAVQRMTARLTLRQGTNRGATGMIISSSGNQNGNEQKYRGRIKLRNQVKQQENQDEDFEEFNKNKTTKDLTEAKQNKEEKEDKPLTKTEIPTSNESGTARFTLGGQGGGRGRIKMRDTKKLEDDEDDDLLI